MHIARPSLLQTAKIMDGLTLAREDSVCQLLQDAAEANKWETIRECGVSGTRERIDLAAWRLPISTVIIEAKKGYAPKYFPQHVAQAARYRDRFYSQVVATTRSNLELSNSAVERSACIGYAVGKLVANDVLLVCPSFDAMNAPQHALEAAGQGILAVNVVDAVRYLSGDSYDGVSDATIHRYQQAKAGLSGPTIADIMAIN